MRLASNISPLTDLGYCSVVELSLGPVDELGKQAECGKQVMLHDQYAIGFEYWAPQRRTLRLRDEQDVRLHTNG